MAAGPQKEVSAKIFGYQDPDGSTGTLIEAAELLVSKTVEKDPLPPEDLPKVDRLYRGQWVPFSNFK